MPNQGVDYLRQRYGQPQQQEETGGFGDVVGLGLRGVFKEAPMQAAATLVGAFQGREGADIGQEQDVWDKFVAEADQSREEYAQDVVNRLGEGFGSEMLQSLPDLGYSAVSIPIAAAGRAAGTGLGVLAGGGVGSAATGAAGFVGGALFAEQAMSRSQEYREALAYLNEYERRKGAPLTPEEAAKVKEDMKNQIFASGKYESIPEAVGAVVETAILGKLLRGAGKGGLVKRGFRGLAQTAGIELPTEAITNIGQQQTREDTVLDTGERVSFLNPADIARSIREVAPGVLTVGGGVATAGTVGNVAMSRTIANRYAKDLGITPEQRKTISNRALRQKGAEIMRFNLGEGRAQGQLPLSQPEMLAVLQGKDIKTILKDRETTGETRTTQAADLGTAEQERQNLEAVAQSLNIPTTVTDPDTGITNPMPAQDLQNLIDERRKQVEEDDYITLQERAYELGIPLVVEEGVYKRKNGKLELNSKGEPKQDKREKTAQELQREIARAEFTQGKPGTAVPEGQQLEMYGEGEATESAFGLRGLQFEDAGFAPQGLNEGQIEMFRQTGAPTRVTAPGQEGRTTTPLGEPILAPEGDVFAESTGMPAGPAPGQRPQAAPPTMVTQYDTSQAYEPINYEEAGGFRGIQAPLDLTEDVNAPAGPASGIPGKQLEDILNGNTVADTPQDRQRVAGHVQSVEAQIANLEQTIAQNEARITLPGFRDAVERGKQRLAEAQKELTRARKAQAKADKLYFEQKLEEQATSQVDKAIVESDAVIDRDERKRMIAERKKDIRELLRRAEDAMQSTTLLPGREVKDAGYGRLTIAAMDGIALNWTPIRARQWFDERQRATVPTRDQVLKEEQQEVLDFVQKPDSILRGGQGDLFSTTPEGVGPARPTADQRVNADALAARRRRQERAKNKYSKADRNQRKAMLKRDIEENDGAPAPEAANGDTAAKVKAAIAAEEVAYEKRAGEYAPSYTQGDFAFVGGTVPNKAAQAREEDRAKRLLKSKVAKMKAARYKNTVIAQFLDEGKNLNEYTVAPLDADGKIWGIVRRPDAGEGDRNDIAGKDVYFDIGKSKSGEGWTVTPRGTAEQIREFERSFPTEGEALQYQQEMNNISFGDEATTVPANRQALKMPTKGAKPAAKKPAAEKPAKQTETTAIPDMDLLVQAAEKLGIEVPLKKQGKNKGQPAIGVQALGKLIKEKMGLGKNVSGRKAAERALAGETPAVEEAAVETPAVEEAAVETPPAEQPAVEEAAVETPPAEQPAVEEPLATAEQKTQLLDMLKTVGVEQFTQLTGLNPNDFQAGAKLTQEDAQDAINNANDELLRAAEETQTGLEPAPEGEEWAAADIPGDDNSPVKGRKRLKILKKGRGDRITIALNGWSGQQTPTNTQLKTFAQLGITDANSALDALQTLADQDDAMTAQAVINTELKTVTFAFADAKGATTFNGAFAEGVKKGAFSATPRGQAAAAPADLTEVEQKMNDFATSEDETGNKRYESADLRVSDADPDLIDDGLQGLANNIEAETNLKIRFVTITGGMVDKNGQSHVPDGYNDGDGNIYVNVLSGQPGNYLLGHEVAHSLQNTEDFKVFKKALDSAAKRAGVTVSAEGYHDFFGMAMNNAQFWDTSANEANRQGVLQKVFDQVLDILDRALATMSPELQLSRDYRQARKLAAQAYARYRDRTPTPPGKPEGSGGAGETATTEGLSASKLDDKRIAAVAAIQKAKMEAIHGPAEAQPTEIEYKAPVSTDVRAVGESLGIQFEDAAERAARDLFSANGYGDEARYLGSIASEMREYVRDGIYDQREATNYMGEVINNLADGYSELADILSDISDDLRSQNYEIPSNINSAGWLRSFMSAIGEVYDRAGADVEAQNEAMLAAAEVEETIDLTDEVQPGDLYQGVGEEARVVDTTSQAKIFQPLRGMDYLPAYGRKMFEGEDTGEEGFFVAEVAGAMNHAWKAMQGMAESRVKDVRDLSGTAINTAPKWMGALSIPKLIDIFEGKIPRLKEWYNTLKDYTGVRDGALNEFSNTIRPLLTNDAEAKKFSVAAGESTFNQVDPTKTLLEQDWVIDFGGLKGAEKAWEAKGWKNTTGHTFAEGYAITLREYRAMAPDTQRIFQQVGTQLKNNRKAELKAYEQKVYELSDNADERAAEMKAVRDLYSSLRGMYFPLGRFGEYFVIGRNKKSGLTDLWAAETVQAAEEIQKEVEATGLYEKVSFSARNEHDALPQAVTQNFLNHTKLNVEKVIDRRYRDAAKKQAKKEGRELTEDELKQIDVEVRTEVGKLTDGMSLLWLNSMPSTAAMKNSIKRKNARGWHEDMVRNVSDYMTRHASNLAALTHGYTLDHELYLMDRELRAANSKGEIAPREFFMRRHLVNHLRRHMDVTRNTPTSGAIGKMATGLASIWYMSSPSAWLVQMSQLGILTLPRLASQHGMTKSIRLMNQMLSNSFDTDYSYKNVVNNAKAKDLYEKIYETASVADVEAGRAKKVGDLIMSKSEVNKAVSALSPRDRQLLALYTAMRKNIVSTTMTNETMELASGRDPGRLMRAALFFMRHGEETSRRTAVLAGFEAEYESTNDFTKALEYAQEINTKTMFDYSKEAKPTWLNEKPALRVVTQFMYYTYSMWAHVAHQFLTASIGVGGATKAKRMQAFKELSFMMGTTAALSGAYGMPLSGMAFAVADTVIHALADDDDEYVFDSKYWFKQQLRENGLSDWLIQIVEEGAPGALDMALSTRTGMAQSFGVGDNFTPAQLRGMRYWDYQLARHIGPSWAAVRDIGLGAETLAETGDIMKAGQMALPKLLRDAFKAINFQRDGGVVDYSGRRWSNEAGSWDTVLLALGVNPYDYASIQRKKRGLARIDARVADQHRRMAYEVAQGAVKGDRQRLERGLQEINAFAQKYPLLAMSSDQLMRAVNGAWKKELGYGSRREQRYEALFRPET